jgi:hypothetical protein
MMMSFLKYPLEMSWTSSMPALPYEKKTAENNAIGAMKSRYETLAGNPGTRANELSDAELTKKKKIGMNKEGISASSGRQICLMLRIER